MDKGEAVQSASSKKSVIAFLLEKGNLKVGDPLGCVRKGDTGKGLQKKEKEDGKSVFIVGIIAHNKILCGCGCLQLCTMSVFEAHAGSNKKRGSQVIFLMDGSLKSLKSLMDEKVEGETWGEAESSSLSSSSCDVCLLTEGEVICCATPSCLTIFHSQCLGIEVSPNGKWYCLKCTCQICDVSLRVNDTTQEGLSKSHCALCGDEYHTYCCLGQTKRPYLHEDGEWFCSHFCEKAFKQIERHVKITLNASNSNTLSETLSLVRCTGSDPIFEAKERSTKQEKLEQKAIEVEKLFHAFLLLRGNFDQDLGMNRAGRFENILYPVNPVYKCGLMLNPMYTRGHTLDFRCLDQYGFYTVLLEMNGEVMTVATIRIHSKQVAEMPFITTSEAHRRKGFCDKLIKHLQRMLKVFGVQTLAVQSPPEFVAMWASKCSLHPTDADARRSLMRCNLLKIEGTILLCKKIS